MGLGFGVGLPGPFSVGGRIRSRDVDSFWDWVWSWIFFVVIIAGWLIYWLVRGAIVLVQWIIIKRRPTNTTSRHRAEPLNSDGSKPQALASAPFAHIEQATRVEAAVQGAEKAGSAAERRIVSSAKNHAQVLGWIALTIAICSSIALIIGAVASIPTLIGLALTFGALFSGVIAVWAITYSLRAIRKAKKFGLGRVQQSGLSLGIVAFCAPIVAGVLAAIVVAIIH